MKNFLSRSVTPVLFALFVIATFNNLSAQEKCGTMLADSLLRARIPGAPTLRDFENWLQQKMVDEASRRNSSARGGAVYTIPVVVHVIHNGDAVGSGENISQAQVNSQIDVLNEDFRRFNSDTVNTPSNFQPVAADAEIEFCLAQIDPSGNIMPEPGIDRVNMGQSTWSSTSDIDNNLKPATIWDPTKYFNIWTVDFGGGGLLGYAQFPEGSGLAGMPTGAQNAQTDGVVIRYSAFGRVGNVNSPYHLGRTTTHEVGHALGLRHIWGDGGCGVDDYCNDTPESDASNYGCPTTHVSCGTVDMVQNYMDYSDDDCVNLFTEDQKLRIRTVMLNSPRRVELLSSTVCQALDQYAISGTVRDAQTLSGIPNAKVRLISTSFNYETTADANGDFSISNVFEDTYNVYGGQWGYVTNVVNNVVVDASTQPIIIDLDDGYYDDFILDFNWNVSGNASTGIWERGEPLGTDYNGNDSNPGNDVTGDYGEDAFVTGNAGGTAGNDDVDNGNTVLTSPVFDLSSYNEPFINYYKWFYNDGGDGNPNDELDITLTNGNTTVTLETIDANTPNSNQWNFSNFRVRDYLTPTANMQFILETSDNVVGVGHIVEAGLDLFRVVDSVSNPNAPPIAAFSGSPASGCPGLSVSFSDESFNNPTSWSWSFPGGTPTSSTQQNPSVTYNNPGAYNVTLIAINAYGQDTLTKTNYVTIENIQADFNATQTSGCPGLEVAFNDQSTCSPVSWNWSFPGGTPSSSTQQNPVVTYNSVGTYDVTLTVSNAGGTNTVTKSAYVDVSLGGAVTPLFEDFESNTFATNGWTIDNPDANITWEIYTVGGSVSGDKAARVNHYNYSDRGQRDGLMTPVLDLTSVGNTTLSFDHAHRRSSTSRRDSLIIYVSTDGGSSFIDRVFAAAEDGSGTFATNYTLQADFVPGSTDDWCFSGGIGASCFTVDLSAYDGMANVVVKFETYNDNGNNIYLDNIDISGVCTAPSQPPVANFTTNSSTSGCGSLTVAFLNQSINNPTSLSWNFPGGTPSTSSQNNPTVTYSTPGTYDVSLTATSGFGTDSMILNDYITVYENPLVGVTGNDVSCYGGSNGLATAAATGGQTPYSYLWSTGPTSQSINGLTTGVYSVTVTDDNGCEGSDSIMVNEPPALVLSASATDDYCGNNNGTASATVTGGTAPYSFVWSNGETGLSISDLNAGSYTVTATDDNGCAKNTTVAVNPNNSGPSATFNVFNVTCFGGNDGVITVNATGGAAPYIYSWSIGANTPTITGLSTGNYTVTIIDNNNCSVTSSVDLDEADEIVVSATTVDATCGAANGEISSSVTGGSSPYTYSWSNGDSNAVISNLSSGTYTVSVTDDDGCLQTASFNISNIGGPTVSVTKSNVSCYNGNDGTASATISGGTMPYTINWSNGSSTTNASGLTGGSYNVTVTDSNNCVSIGSVTVNQPAPVAVAFTVVDAKCGNANGEVTLSTTGGTPPYVYQWSNGNTTSLLTGVVSNTYIITVTDDNGCTITDSVFVNNNAGPSVTVNLTNPTCYGATDGAANASVVGGTPPYNYDWSNGASSQIVTGLIAGTYQLTVTDANNCTKIKTINITQPSKVNVFANITPATCGNNDGAVTLSTSGGNPPYQYLWSTGQISSSISNLSSGSYDLTVTDANNCYTTSTVNVSNIGGPTINLLVTDISCNGGNNGSVSVNISGGTAPYIFNWSNGESSQNLNSVHLGNYTVTVTDANGCNTIGDATVTEPLPLALSLDVEHLICRDKFGSIEAHVLGGAPPYGYSWSDGGSSSLNNNIGAGWYTLTVTDTNGCTIIDSAELITISDLQINLISTPDTSNSGIGTAMVNVLSGAPPYTYQWNDPDSQTTQVADSLMAGYYIVTVVDSNGCEVVDSVTVGSVSGIEALLNDGVRVYPNPNTGQFIIEFNNPLEGKVNVEVFDSYGRLVVNIRKQPSTGRKLRVDLTKFARGIYILRIKNKENSTTRRIVYTASY